MHDVINTHTYSSLCHSYCFLILIAMMTIKQLAQSIQCHKFSYFIICCHHGYGRTIKASFLCMRYIALSTNGACLEYRTTLLEGVLVSFLMYLEIQTSIFPYLYEFIWTPDRNSLKSFKLFSKLSNSFTYFKTLS